VRNGLGGRRLGIDSADTRCASMPRILTSQGCRSMSRTCQRNERVASSDRTIWTARRICGGLSEPHVIAGSGVSRPAPGRGDDRWQCPCSGRSGAGRGRGRAYRGYWTVYRKPAIALARLCPVCPVALRWRRAVVLPDALQFRKILRIITPTKFFESKSAATVARRLGPGSSLDPSVG
jgi:hypothetical protein